MFTLVFSYVVQHFYVISLEIPEFGLDDLKFENKKQYCFVRKNKIIHEAENEVFC